MKYQFTVAKLLVLIAVIIFVLVGIEYEPSDEITLLGFGLAFFAAAYLVP